MILLSFIFLASTFCFAGYFGWRRYGTLMNPVTLFSVSQGLVFSFISGMVCWLRDVQVPYPPENISKINVISGVALIAYCFAFLKKGTPLNSVTSSVITFLRLDRSYIEGKFNLSFYVLLVFIALSAFVTLAILGGGGWLWLLDARTAYMYYRVGVGPFYAAAQWFLLISAIYLLHGLMVESWIKCACISLFYGALAFFSGSKGNILIVIIIIAAYYDYNVKRISVKTALGLFGVMSAVFFGLLSVQGFTVGSTSGYLYFGDYVDTTARFMSEVDDWGLQYGRVLASSMWRVVPRILFPQKPYEYGELLIHARLFPGAAEAGDTPGVLSWVGPYWDFGIVGVIISTVLYAVLHRAIFEYYRTKNRDCIVFMITLQFGPIPIFPFAPLPLVLCICWGVAVVGATIAGDRQRHRPRGRLLK
jgi:hypothetical protein